MNRRQFLLAAAAAPAAPLARPLALLAAPAAPPLIAGGELVYAAYIMPGVYVDISDDAARRQLVRVFTG